MLRYNFLAYTCEIIYYVLTYIMYVFSYHSRIISLGFIKSFHIVYIVPLF